MTDEIIPRLTTSCLSIFSCDYGVLISAPAEIQELCLIAEFYRKNYGYDILSGEIGELTGCLCLTNEKYVKPWVEEIKKGWTKEICMMNRKSM